MICKNKIQSVYYKYKVHTSVAVKCFADTIKKTNMYCLYF